LRPLVSASAWLAALLVRAGRRLGVRWNDWERRGFLPIPLHYYQPFPRAGDLERSGFWQRRSDLAGVQIDWDDVLDRLASVGRFASECDWPETSNDPRRYHCANGTFGFTSAAVAHGMLRLLRPHRVLEVGSGYSTHILCAALAANAADDGTDPELVSVEPFPATILDTDLPRLKRRIREPVERLGLDLFEELAAGDVLFIDSTHVLRYGGDVEFLYLSVLPRLAEGVVVHVHDIHLPDPYPRTYFDSERWVWNEQQLLQAFLAHNQAFRVLLPCWWIHRDHDEAFRRAFRRYDPDLHRPGSSFWMERVPRGDP